MTSLRQTKDGNALLISTLDSTVRLIDKGDGKLLKSYIGHKNTDYRVRATLALNDSIVISGSEDGSLFAWDLVDGSVTEKIVGAHGQKVVSAVDSNPGSGRSGQWASAGSDGTYNHFLHFPSLSRKPTICTTPALFPRRFHPAAPPHLHVPRHMALLGQWQRGEVASSRIFKVRATLPRTPASAISCVE